MIFDQLAQLDHDPDPYFHGRKVKWVFLKLKMSWIDIECEEEGDRRQVEVDPSHPKLTELKNSTQHT